MQASNIRSFIKEIAHLAPWVSLRYHHEHIQDRTYRNGVAEQNLNLLDEGCMIEVLVDGHYGYSGTSDVSKRGIKEGAEKAMEMARALSRYKIFSFSPSPAAHGNYVSPRQVPSAALKHISDRLKTYCGWLKVSEAVQTTLCSSTMTNLKTHFVSNTGSDIEQDFLFIANSFSATAEKNGQTQTRTLNGGRGRCWQSGFEVFDNPELENLCRQTGEQAVELVNSENCPSDTRTLILMPDQMMLQIHESVGHPLELDRILGDERNYAGWSHVKLEDFGKLQFGSSLMNITFDPSIKSEFATFAFDDCGQPATKSFIIKDGRLVAALGGRQSQERANVRGVAQVSGVANSRAQSWFRPPIDRMANLNLEPGKSSLAQIIGQTEKGIIMHANRSWSIDDYRNKFQFGCEYGQLVENGKITKTVKNPNYRGVSIPFWHNLVAVGDSSTFETYGTPYCGKGEPNQIVRVGHGSPVCMFKDIEVFGGIN